MALRLALGFAALLLAAAPAGADTISQRKHAVDTRLARLNEKVARARHKEATLRGQIASVTGQIRSLERQVGDVSTRLAPLERELELRELRLNRLNALFELQRGRLRFLRHQYASALRRLDDRLVAIYESGEDTSTLEIVLSARSFSDFLDAFDYVRQIGDEDKRIADEVGTARDHVRVVLAHTRRTRVGVLSETRVVAVRVAQVRALRDQLLTSRDRLAGARARKKQSLATLTRGERAEASEIDSLNQVSAELAAKIRAAQAAARPSSGPADTTPSQAGLIWPVSGPVTSPFGWRWGRMHEGIDIGVPYGTPIHAAAAGTVIYAGWLGGYGNLVVIDHGGGLATAYGHQSQIAVSEGEQVSQGQVIGYVGCTGHCFGPHLHFEVRVNGQAVDPLGYL